MTACAKCDFNHNQTKIERRKCYYRVWVRNNRDKVKSIRDRWKSRNKDKIKSDARAYYKKNKKKMRLARREWYARNRQKAIAITTKWQKKNPEKVKACMRRQLEKPHIRFNQAKLGAKKRDHAWRLRYYQWVTLTQLPCHYCGTVLGNRGCGLDRVDNSLGYSLKNCVPCCGGCNRAKHSATYSDFIVRANKIAQLHPLGRKK